MAESTSPIEFDELSLIFSCLVLCCGLEPIMSVCVCYAQVSNGEDTWIIEQRLTTMRARSSPKVLRGSSSASLGHTECSVYRSALRIQAKENESRFDNRNTGRPRELFKTSAGGGHTELSCGP